MPYNSSDELPDSVTNVLPAHAQDIYKEAFNSAWDQYKNESDRQGNDEREETAHKVAWSAVRKSYHKDNSGKWQKNS